MIASLSRWQIMMVGLLLTGLSGCATTSFCTSCCWPMAEPIPHGEVQQVMTLWADGICEQPDVRTGNPTPGFSGRVFLIGAKPTDALAADGDLVVHMYDAAQPKTADRVPVEVWNIHEVDLVRFVRKDTLGWGYNLWLPCNTFHPGLHRVELVVKYQPKVGIPVWSGATKVAVSEGGKLRPPSQLEIHSDTRHPDMSIVNEEPSIRASTIRVPGGSSLSRPAQEARTLAKP
jgi:hypothetical protein